MKKVVYCLIIGLVITLITGVINSTPSGLLGATWYGLPAAWRFVLVTDPPVTHYNVASFIVDWIFWFVIAHIFMYIWKKGKAK